jgi:hypothetical protein
MYLPPRWVLSLYATALLDSTLGICSGCVVCASVWHLYFSFACPKEKYQKKKAVLPAVPRFPQTALVFEWALRLFTHHRVLLSHPNKALSVVAETVCSKRERLADGLRYRA